ncbi:MAG: chemotaxis protein CheW, partial [Gemmatimonadota bacterium]|nr:chemotaxis protein CheW [Gemmatimonadota bacterium]
GGSAGSGLTVWRGALLPVIDLRLALGLAADGLDDRAWIVVLDDGRRLRGLLAGALRDTREIRAATLAPPRDDLAANRRFVRGITTDAVVVLDAAALLNTD